MMKRTVNDNEKLNGNICKYRRRIWNIVVHQIRTQILHEIMNIMQRAECSFILEIVCVCLCVHDADVAMTGENWDLRGQRENLESRYIVG